MYAVMHNALRKELVLTFCLCVCARSDGKGRMSNPVLLSTGGLISAAISFRKNWLAI
jgi:hypothetical protein